MRKSILIKAFGMIAVFGAMVLWSCSQDEEIEEQMEWSKKAVKKKFSKKWINKDRKLYIQDILFVLPWLSDRNISWYIFYRPIYKN